MVKTRKTNKRRKLKSNNTKKGGVQFNPFKYNLFGKKQFANRPEFKRLSIIEEKTQPENEKPKNINYLNDFVNCFSSYIYSSSCKNIYNKNHQIKYIIMSEELDKYCKRTLKKLIVEAMYKNENRYNGRYLYNSFSHYSNLIKNLAKKIIIVTTRYSQCAKIKDSSGKWSQECIEYEIKEDTESKNDGTKQTENKEIEKDYYNYLTLQDKISLLILILDLHNIFDGKKKRSKSDYLAVISNGVATMDSSKLKKIIDKLDEEIPLYDTYIGAKKEANIKQMNQTSRELKDNKDLENNKELKQILYELEKDLNNVNDEMFSLHEEIEEETGEVKREKLEENMNKLEERKKELEKKINEFKTKNKISDIELEKSSPVYEDDDENYYGGRKYRSRKYKKSNKKRKTIRLHKK